VVDEIKCIGRDPGLIKETLTQARRDVEHQIESLQAERTELGSRLRKIHRELGQMAAAHADDSEIADAHGKIQDAERRLTEVDDDLAGLDKSLVDEADVATALADFNALWECLAPREQARVVELLVESVTFDERANSVSITFRPSGIKTLAGDMADRKGEAA
jgi:site-specific DNA recombinase